MSAAASAVARRGCLSEWRLELANSSMRILMQPAIGMAMMAPIRPNMYPPIVTEERTRRAGSFMPRLWTLGEMRLASTWR